MSPAALRVAREPGNASDSTFIKAPGRAAWQKLLEESVYRKCDGIPH